MSGFEPEVRDYLRRIVLSFVLGLIWLVLNMTLGIYLGWMFFFDRPTAGNFIFYIFMFSTLVLYCWFLRRTWTKRFPHG
jgi:hypothetical protein